MIGVEVAAPGQDLLGESPVWCDVEQALYWVDIRAPALRRLHPETSLKDVWTLPDPCGAVVLGARPGRMVVGQQCGLFSFDLRSEALEHLVSPEPTSLGHRLNDTRCDRRGRIWTGTMRDGGGWASAGALYRIEPSLSCQKVSSGLSVPNALCWSPDNRTLYFADTRDGRLRAYPFEPDEGRLGEARILLAADGAPGRPDGATVDSEGCVWNARYGGGCLVRVTPDGRIDRTVELPVTQPTSCSFGGSDLRTLYITTARQRLTEEELARQPLAGSLLAIRVATPGLPEPRFAL